MMATNARHGAETGRRGNRRPPGPANGTGRRRGQSETGASQGAGVSGSGPAPVFDRPTEAAPVVGPLVPWVVPRRQKKWDFGKGVFPAPGIRQFGHRVLGCQRVLGIFFSAPSRFLVLAHRIFSSILFFSPSFFFETPIDCHPFFSSSSSLLQGLAMPRCGGCDQLKPVLPYKVKPPATERRCEACYRSKTFWLQCQHCGQDGKCTAAGTCRPG